MKQAQPRPIRVLLVAFANSVHTARWVSQLACGGFDLHIFPPFDSGQEELHPQLQFRVTVHRLLYRHAAPPAVKVTGLRVNSALVCRAFYRVLRRFRPDYRVRYLVRTIRRLRPDVVHSLETQRAGYLAAEAKKRMRTFPPWIHANWGSDIYLFGRFEEHASRIRAVLQACDYYTCECQRDVQLARDSGLRGRVLEVMPSAGGFHLHELESLRSSRPSTRTLIMVKGYQDWAGRALVALRSLERAADAVRGCEIVVYACRDESVSLAARLLAIRTGLSVRILPSSTPYAEILAHHGRARISVGLSISDGVPTAFLEALLMGSLPIQSWTSAADEWIEDGVTGLLVPPEDSDVVELAIRRALTDDALVDRAAVLNWETAQRRLRYEDLRQRAVAMYRRVYEETTIRK